MEGPQTPTKSEIRARMKAGLASLSPDERRTGSEAICARIVDTVRACRARTLMVYLAMPDEVDLTSCITRCLEGGVHVRVPRIDWDRKELTPVAITSLDGVRTGRHGVPLPPEGAPVASDLDMILVPGLAFDEHRNRLGRGAGFYDRFLNEHPARTVGVAFEFQVLPAIPMDAWDIPLHSVATPNRWIE